MRKKMRKLTTKHEFDSYVVEKKDKRGRWRLCQERWAFIYGITDKEAVCYFEQKLEFEKRWSRGKKIKRNYRLVKIRSRLTREEIKREPLKQVRRTF